MALSTDLRVSPYTLIDTAWDLPSSAAQVNISRTVIIPVVIDEEHAGRSDPTFSIIPPSLCLLANITSSFFCLLPRVPPVWEP